MTVGAFHLVFKFPFPGPSLFRCGQQNHIYGHIYILGVSFALAQLAFFDHQRIILEDLEHSGDENRYYCLGKVTDGILTVRFTYRKNKIRIIFHLVPLLYITLINHKEMYSDLQKLAEDSLVKRTYLKPRKGKS